MKAFHRELIDYVLAKAPDADAGEVAAVLEEQIAACRSQWPALAEPDIETAGLWWQRAVEATIAKGTSFVRALASLQSADLHLVSLCGRGDQVAIGVFDECFLKDVGTVIIRVSDDASFADEVRQIVREKLLVASKGGGPRIVELGGRGDLAALVRVVALRSALNLRRSMRADKEITDHDMLDLLAASEDSSGALDSDRRRVKQAFETALARLDPRDRNVLRMHLLHGASIDEIGRSHGVHRATAARWLNHIRDRLYESTCRALSEDGLSEGAQKSALRLVDSQFEISFERLLG